MVDYPRMHDVATERSNTCYFEPLPDCYKR